MCSFNADLYQVRLSNLTVAAGVLIPQTTKLRKVVGRITLPGASRFRRFINVPFAQIQRISVPPPDCVDFQMAFIVSYFIFLCSLSLHTTFITFATAASSVSWRGLSEESGSMRVTRRGYEDLDPKYDFCEMGFHQSAFHCFSTIISIDSTTGKLISVSIGAVLDNTLWIHGGYVGYDNGTQASEPSTPKHLLSRGMLYSNSDI
jgi:hypothetical protein